MLYIHNSLALTCYTQPRQKQQQQRHSLSSIDGVCSANEHSSIHHMHSNSSTCRQSDHVAACSDDDDRRVSRLILKSTDMETTAGINAAAIDSATLPDFYCQVDTARYYVWSGFVKICIQKHTTVPRDAYCFILKVHKYHYYYQFFDTVAWVAGRASGL